MRTQNILALFILLIAAMSTVLESVEGFSLGSPSKRSTPVQSSFPAQRRFLFSPMISKHSSSYLRVANQDGAKNENNENRIKKFCGIFKRGTTQCTTQLIRLWLKSRRSLLMMSAVVLFWFGVAGIHTQASHGSSSSATTSSVSRNIFSSSLDQIADTYVKSHMFDDDVYDPVESLYREAMDDRLKGSYPKDLKETTSSVLGQNVIKADKKASGTGFSGVLMKSVGFLRKQGLSEMQAIAIVTSFFVIGGPAVFFGVLMQIATQNKRSMNRMMKNRYGETYTVDASEKIEEDVDAPDDDDDDDDDDE